MILGERREAVIENIAAAAREGDFHRKVEMDDPVLTAAQEKEILESFLEKRRTWGYRWRSFWARRTANAGTGLLNRDTKLVGLEKAAAVRGGAIVTSNHFSPLDNTVVRHMARKLGKRRIHIISQLTNFAMTGPIGFLMNYADTLPLSDQPQYLMRTLPAMLEELVNRDEWVLIYPEKEMWFNYRKPRPCLRGAYHFAAKLGRPLISCFVEMQDRPEMDKAPFHKVRYVLHVLDVLRPDPEKSVRENSIALCQQDYELKKAAYEAIYGKPLTYDFSPEDIAGWEAGQ